MKARILRWIGLGLAGVTLGLIAGAVGLTLRNEYALGTQAFLLGVIVAALVGGLLTWERPMHLIGWLIAAFAFCFALGEFSRQYVIYGAFRSAGLPALRVMAIPVYFIWYPGLMFALVLLPLYFPAGKLLSPRWRPVVWFSVITFFVGSALQTFRPNADEIPGYPNPLGNSAMYTASLPIDFIAEIFQFVWLGLSALAVLSLILRFRRSRGVERQQLKWFTFALAALVVVMLVSRVMNTLPLPLYATDILFAVALSGVWVAVAIAVLLYHLYDIDLIIRRTITYSVVTVLLLLIYFGSVIVLQRALAAVTDVRENEIVTVVSTLAIAALFVPLRNRVQQMIDRRFNRNRYDAQEVLARFAQTVRDETDLEKLSNDLVQVMNETMQPKNVSLWLMVDGSRRELSGSEGKI